MDLNDYTPDSGVDTHYPVEVYDTPEGDLPKYGSVSVRFPSGGGSVLTRITLRQAFELHAALGGYLGLNTVVESVDGLEDLPIGSRVRGEDGYKHEKIAPRRWILLDGVYGEFGVESVALPARVLPSPAEPTNND